MGDNCFRWNCPYLSCEETFTHAWKRRDHLRINHWNREQNESVESQVDEISDAPLSQNSEFALPKVFKFGLEVPIKSVPKYEHKTDTKDASSTNINTPYDEHASTPTEPRGPPQKYSLFDGGDFTVVLGSEEEGEVEILVSSNSLCVCCKVWKNICSEGFREFVDRKVKFPEDDPDSMLLLFYIAHLKFNKVPAEMSLKALGHIAVVCDKYDISMLLQPWMRGWVDKYRSNWKVHQAKDLLLIFWVFGDAKSFEDLAKRSVYRGTCEEGSGILTIHDGITFDETFQVPNIIESILEAREKTITALCYLCDSYIGELTQTSGCRLCSGSLCSALQLGSLMQGLNKIGLWPTRPVEMDHKSTKLRELHQSLLNLNFPATPQSPDPFQSKCIGILKFDFANEVTRIYNSVDPVLPFHREKLKERNIMLGLFPEKDIISPTGTAGDKL